MSKYHLSCFIVVHTLIYKGVGLCDHLIKRVIEVFGTRQNAAEEDSTLWVVHLHEEYIHVHKVYHAFVEVISTYMNNYNGVNLILPLFLLE